MQQPSEHRSRSSPHVHSLPAVQRILAGCFLWWAVINTSITMPDRSVYSSIHGPFQTGEKCLAFTRLFLSTYDDKASGAHIAGAFCVEPYKKKVIR